MIALFVIVMILGSSSAQSTTMKSMAPAAPAAGTVATMSPLEMSICETLKPKDSPGITFINQFNVDCKKTPFILGILSDFTKDFEH